MLRLNSHLVWLRMQPDMQLISFCLKIAHFIKISYDFTMIIKSKPPHFMDHGRTDMVQIVYNVQLLADFT